jgi:hypothetical protein
MPEEEHRTLWVVQFREVGGSGCELCDGFGEGSPESGISTNGGPKCHLGIMEGEASCPGDEGDGVEEWQGRWVGDVVWGGDGALLDIELEVDGGKLCLDVCQGWLEVFSCADENAIIKVEGGEDVGVSCKPWEDDVVDAEGEVDWAKGVPLLDTLLGENGGGEFGEKSGWVKVSVDEPTLQLGAVM